VPVSVKIISISGFAVMINTQHSVSAEIQAESYRHDEIEDDHDASRVRNPPDEDTASRSDQRPSRIPINMLIAWVSSVRALRRGDRTAIDLGRLSVRDLGGFGPAIASSVCRRVSGGRAPSSLRGPLTAPLIRFIVVLTFVLVGSDLVQTH
jgi:hypothetical protein